jgi:hypothetical protein
MYQDDLHDDPVVVYRASAILLAAFALALLILPLDWLLGGLKSPPSLVAISGDVGTRLLLAVPCGLLAAWVARKGWGADG